MVNASHTVGARTTEEKIRICLFSDFQKSRKGKYHTELICIIIDSFIKSYVV